MKAIPSNSTENQFPWRAILIFFGAFIVSLFYLKKVYFNLCIAFTIAYLLEPIVGFLERKRISRTFGSLLVLMFFTFLLILIFILMTPKILSQGQELLSRLPVVYRNILDLLSSISMRTLKYNVFADLSQTLNPMNTSTSEMIKPFGGIVGSVFATSFQFISSILGFLIIPLLSFYLLKEFPYLYKRTFHKALPEHYHRISDEIRKRLNFALGGFLRGQMVVSTVLSFYYCTALTIAGLDLSLVLGIMAGFFNIVPYIGIITVLILSLLIAFIHAATASELLVIIVIFLVGMIIEGSVLTPKILGKRVGLSPLTLIIALLVGGELFGILGMVIAVPVAAVIKVFIDMALEHRLKIG